MEDLQEEVYPKEFILTLWRLDETTQERRPYWLHFGYFSDIVEFAQYRNLSTVSYSADCDADIVEIQVALSKNNMLVTFPIELYARSVSDDVTDPWHLWPEEEMPSWDFDHEAASQGELDDLFILRTDV